jgi:tetratricopeptide (TPR) repeat protein
MLLLYHYMEGELKTKKSFLKTISEKMLFRDSKNILPLDKTIKYLIYILVVLIPLWFLPISINAVEFNKQALMVLLVVITLILWLIKVLNQGELKWKSNILNIALGAFLIICILATIFSLRSHSSLVGWPSHLSGSLINILTFIALYVLIINNFKGIKQTFGLLFAFLVSSALVTIIGLLQLWGGFIFSWDFTKIISFNTIGTVNTLGIFSAVVLTLITALLFVIQRSEIRIFFVILGILNLIILLNINFWVLWLILAIGMAIILVFGLMRVVRLEENISWIALPMVFLAIALIFVFFRPALPFQPNLPVEVGLSYKGGWDVIQEILKERPILGTGPETFVFNYTKYKPEAINQTVFWNVRFSNPPSEILSVISDLGILGFLSFLAVMILFTFQAIKNLIRTSAEEVNILKRFLEIALFAGWLGLAISWFLYPQNLTLMFIFWFLLALYLAESSVFKDKTYNLRKSPKVLLITSFSFVVLIVAIVGFLYVQGTRFVAEAKYKTGMDLIQKEGELDQGLDKIIRATVINPYEDRTYRVLAQLFILKMNRDAVLPDLSQQERANLIQVDAINAINSASRATRLSPKDVSNWLVRGQTYSQVMGLVEGATSWAESSFEEATVLEPLNPFILTEWGRAYVKENDLVTALEKFNQAIAVKPDYAPAHFETALVFDQQGKLAEAIAKMEINKQLLPQDTGVAFQLAVLYYKAQRYEQAKAEFIRAIVLDTNFSNARYFLGLLYDREGNKQGALDQFEKIAELNPDNEHVQQVIANLKAGQPALGSPALGPPQQPEQIPIEQGPTEQP